MKPLRNPLFHANSIRYQIAPPIVAAVATILSMGSPSAHAALTWNSAGPSNNWSTAAGNGNWNPGGVVWTQNESAVFDGTSGTPEAIAVSTVNTFDNITFDVSGFSITSAGAGSFVLANDLASTISVTNLADSATISETIADNSGLPSSLTKAGLGTLTLSPTATSTYTGGTIVSSGTLISTITPTISAISTGPVSISTGATLNLNNTNTVNTTPIINNAFTGTGLLKLTFAAGTTARNTTMLNVNGFNGTIQLSTAGATGDKWNAPNLGTVTAPLIIDSGAQIVTSGTTAATFTNGITVSGTGNSENRGAIRLLGPMNANITLAGSATIGPEGGALTGNITSGAAGSQILTIGTANSASGGTFSGIIGGGTGTIGVSIARGTVALTGANTYTDKTTLGAAGAAQVNVSSLNSVNGGTPLLATSSLGAPTTIANGTIDLGSGNSSGTLNYTGTGETTDRVINLASTIATNVISQSGTGLLKFTSDLTAIPGDKALTLNGSTAGSGEISGNIGNLFINGVALSTTTTAAFTTTSTTISVNSVTGVVIGATISGTGFTGNQRITSITGTGPFTIGLSAVPNAAGTLGQVINFTPPANAITKDGSGSWKLSGNNTFSGSVNINAGPLVITNSNAIGTGTKNIQLANGTAGNPSLRLDGSAGAINLPSTFTYTTSNQTFEGCLVNVAGNNSVAGQINITSGGGGFLASSLAGDLTISANITSTTSGRAVFLSGPSTGTVSGIISNGSTAGMPVSKDGTGTWALTGANTFTGSTTVNNGTLLLSGTGTNTSSRIVNGGTMVISGDYSAASGNTTAKGGILKLDYSTADSGKIGDGSTLVLSGGTVELAGGTHAEVVANTTLTTGTSSVITRSSGTATLNLRAVSGNGKVVLSETSIATTDTNNINGNLPWARVIVGGVPVLAKNSTDTFDGPIVPFTAFNDITRLGVSAVPNNPTDTIRIINGGTTGNITLAAAPLTQVNFLQMSASDGAATIAPTAATDVLSIGTDLGGTLWQSAGAGALTIGTAANDGVLTTGDVDNGGAAVLTLTNDSTNPLVVNSTIANNGTDPVSLILSGTGPITVGGSITSTGTITTAGSTVATLNGNITGTTAIAHGSSGLLTVNGAISGTSTVAATGGSMILNGANSFSGALTVANGQTVTLTGDNSLRPAGVTGLTTISTGGTLQLQANGGNTISGVSSALSQEKTANQPLVLATGGVLQLRSDSTVLFTGANAFGGLGSATVTIDVNQLTGAGTGNTLSMAPLGFDVNTTTINVTGGNGYTLGLGKVNNVAAAGVATLNPTTGSLTVDGYSANATLSTTLVLGGTASGNVVTGAIVNPATSGATSVTKSGTGTWTIANGANTYTGTTTISGGTLKPGSATTFNNLGALGMSGTGTLDLNALGATFTNVASSAVTNTITDNSSGAGTTSLAISNQSSTVSALVKNGPAKAVRVLIKNANTSTVPFAITNANTFSGGLVLQHNATGTRLRISAPPTTVGSPGAIVSGPFGTGPITIGEANTDKAGILLDTSVNFTIVNDIVFNTALGTDQPGIRLDTTGHVFSGTITANLANALFTNTGSARLTGKITGANGLQLNASAVTITLNNSAANNDYLGDTILGAGTSLILATTNQIPDGVGKGDVTANGTLNLAGFSEGINGLSGTTGTITSTSGSPVLTVGNEDSSGVYSGVTAGTLSFVKTGSGIQTLGVIGHSGDTTVAGGILSVSVASTFANSSAIRLTSGTTLNLSTAGTDVVNTLFIDGVGQASGTWGRIGSGAAHETALITGPGLLNVTTSGSTPYSLWAAAKGLTPGVNDAPTADPDGDGDTNLKEYAFDGNPLSGASSGKVVGKIGLVGGSNFMTLTFPARTGAVFTNASGPDVSAAIDGVTYRIEGSDTLGGGSWTLDVTEVTGGDAATIQSGLTLPGLTPGWTYRTFRAPTTTTGNPSDFLRAGAE